MPLDFGSMSGSHGVTRRQFLAGAAAASLSLAAVACSPSLSPSTPANPGVIHAAIDALHPVFDVHDWNLPSGPRTFAPLFDALTFIDSGGMLRPALALAWSQTSATTWQFRLREADAKFQNGEFFDGESVRLSVERAIDPGRNLALTPFISTIDHVDVVDSATVNVVTKTPDPILPWRLSLVYVLPPRAFNQQGAQAFFQRPIGTGQWLLDSFQADRGMSLRFFTDTWRGARGEPVPSLKRLEVVVIPSATERVSALRSGDVDVALDITQADAEALEKSGYKIVTAQPGVISTYQFGSASGQFSDATARQAINLAVDRSALLSQVSGGRGSIVPGQLAVPGVPGFNQGLAAPVFDRDRARDLASRSTLSEGPVSVWALPDGHAAAESIVQALQGIGVSAAIRETKFSDYVKFLAGPQRDGLFPWPAPYGFLMDADAAYTRFSAATPPTARFSSDAQFDSAFSSSRRAPDLARHAQTLASAAARWSEQNLGIALLQTPAYAGLAPGVKGLAWLPNGSWWFDRMLK